MQVQADGWLTEVKRCISPNFNARPQDTSISLIVIHNISLPPGQFGGGYIEHFFTNQLDTAVDPYFPSIAPLEVSAHFLIERTGAVVQFVSCDQRAWHAGRSCFAEQPECNDYAIGIELEGTDTVPYTAAQYRVLAQVVSLLQEAYPAISSDRITGHSDIAPGRKTDPGPAFDWQRLQRALS